MTQPKKALPAGWPRVSCSMYYDDPARAIDWLCDAFGFEVRLKVEGDDGYRAAKRDGAEGVGVATNRAIVHAAVLCIVLNMFLSALMYA